MRLTCFPNPHDAHTVLVSCRDDGQRTLRAEEPLRPRVIRCRGAEREFVDQWPGFTPAHGHRAAADDDSLLYSVPPHWRLRAPDMPVQKPPWLRCVLLFVWSDTMAAVHFDGDTCVVDSTSRALGLLRTRRWSPDVLFVCTQAAADAVRQRRNQLGWLAVAQWAPVVCAPDNFARSTSLDRAADGSGAWYRPPFLLDPLAHMSAVARQEAAHRLAVHRAQWIEERALLDMMFALVELTRLPLHEVAEAQQTVLADALIERTWCDDPLNVPPPRLAPPGGPSDEERRRFAGASVLDARIGLHCGTVLWPDVSSLYPNVVREYLADDYPLYATLFARMIEFRRDQRDPVRAGSAKVVTNAVFGSRKHGRYRDVQLAERIAECGRRVQRESIEAVRAAVYGVELLGGDTDALAWAVRGDVATTRAALLTALNGQRRFALYKAQMDEFSCVLLVNNKSWAGLRADDGRIVTKGLAQNKSDTPRFVLASHHEWCRLVLTDVTFQTNAAVRTEWLERRAAQLVATRHALRDLVVWPKPTLQHPETERGYLLVARTRTEVPYVEYARPGRSRLPVDVARLVQLYLVNPLRAQHEALIK